MQEAAGADSARLRLSSCALHSHHPHKVRSRGPRHTPVPRSCWAEKPSIFHNIQGISGKLSQCSKHLLIHVLFLPRYYVRYKIAESTISKVRPASWKGTRCLHPHRANKNCHLLDENEPNVNLRHVRGVALRLLPRGGDPGIRFLRPAGNHVAPLGQQRSQLERVQLRAGQPHTIIQFIPNSTRNRCLVKCYRGSTRLHTSYSGSHPIFMLRALKRKVSFCLLLGAKWLTGRQ